MTLAKTSFLQFILPVLRKVCGKFAESPCASRDREKKKRETGGFARWSKTGHSRPLQDASVIARKISVYRYWKNILHVYCI